MSTTKEIHRLVEEWGRTLDEGQNLPAEAFTDDPKLAARLQEEIDYLIRAEELMSQTSPELDAPLAEEAGSVLEVANRYELRDHIARAGMGDVFRAYDTQLRREVALKIAHARLLEDPRRIERFRREASVTGQLNHPGIAAIYSSGESEAGRPFHSMRLIAGQSLEVCGGEIRRENDIARFRELIRHFISACQTVHYAHRRGVLHNDIKPAHIVAGKFGETVVLDWGEATKTSETSAVTEATPTFGIGRDCPAGATPSYAAPERATEPPTVASDVYSLGATLYFLIHARPPREEGSPTQTLTRLGRRQRRGLETILRKAIDANPHARYSSAAALAQDLQRWLDDEPLDALPDSVTLKAGRFSRRHSLKLIAVGLVIAAATGSASVILYNNQVAAGKAQQKEMVNLLRTATDGVTDEIERRWTQLNGITNDSGLKALMTEATESAEGFENLQAFLEYRRNHLVTGREHDRISSLFILDADGRQLGRYPHSVKLKFGVSRNLAHKSYFHGQPEQFAQVNNSKFAISVEPLQQKSISTVFWSATDERRKIAYSMPIRFDGEVKGVLVMTVEAKNFPLPQSEGFDVMVIDTRKDWEGRDQVVLRHSSISEETLRKELPRVAVPVDRESFGSGPDKRELFRSIDTPKAIGRPTPTGLVVAVVKTGLPIASEK